MAVGTSRCIIAAHFPHQVVLGLFAGIYCGIRLQWKMLHSSRRKIFMTGVGLLVSGLGFYYVMKNVLNFDINWSISFAELYCKKLSWVRKSTLTPFFCLVFFLRRIAARGTFFSSWGPWNHLYPIRTTFPKNIFKHRKKYPANFKY